MARIRSIKPEFWTSEQVADCSPTARLLFLGMWNFCDDQGVHPDSAKRLKMEVFPGDDLTVQQVEQLLIELISSGLLYRFEANGESFLFVTGWHHQKIEKPQKRYAAPPDAALIRQSFAERSPTSRRTVADQTPLDRSGVDRSGVDRNGVEGSGEEKGMSGKPDVSDSIRQVFDHYRNYHPRFSPKPSSRSKEWIAVSARLSEGFSVEDLCLAIDGIHKSPYHCGQNANGTKYQKLELCMRHGGQVTGFIEAATEPAGPILSEKTRRSKAAGDAWLEREMASDE